MCSRMMSGLSPKQSWLVQSPMPSYYPPTYSQPGVFADGHVIPYPRRAARRPVCSATADSKPGSRRQARILPQGGL
jgi:hypothetical protein